MQPRMNGLQRIDFTKRNAFWNHQVMIIGHKLNFMTTDCDAQMQYFVIRVANFRPLYLKHFWVKIQSFCAHWTGNFLSFSQLTQLLSVAHFLWPLGAFKR